MKKTLYFIVVISKLFFSSCSEKETSKNTNIDILKEKRSSVFNKNWLGEWERPGMFYQGKLKIKQKGDSIYFELFAQNGANEGMLEGVIPTDGNNAVYFTDEYGDSCKINFSLYGDSVIVLDEEKIMCGAGNGVNYSGNYYNSKNIKNKEISETLVSSGVLNSDKEEEVFKSLVGDSSYVLFINSAHMVTEGEDLDGFNSRVSESGVRGMFTFMENIVMITDSTKIWAAVIDDNKVRYFTNDDQMKDKLPLTIEKWRERFKDYEVIYQK